jgi:hypothetical protein
VIGGDGSQVSAIDGNRPGRAVFLTVLSFNLGDDGLRDALDPRSR